MKVIKHLLSTWLIVSLQINVIHQLVSEQLQPGQVLRCLKYSLCYIRMMFRVKMEVRIGETSRLDAICPATQAHPQGSRFSVCCWCLFVVCCVGQEHDVETAHGVLHVTMRGVAKGNRPTILTYHDIGLNRE